MDFELHLQDEQTNYERCQDIRVLVIDDEKDVCCRVSDCLNQADAAVNGMEVVERFSQMPEYTYDAIFMDIQMPVMNGYQATEAIRKLKNHKDAQTVPILAMTANAFADMNLLGVALSRLLNN